MKKIILLSFILSLLSFNSLTDWFVYESEKFKISFPEKPTEEEKIAQTLAGEVKAKTFVYKAKSANEKNLRYYMSVNDLPSSAENLTIEQQNTSLDAAINGSVRNHKATLISKKSIELNSYLGREVKMSINEDKIIAKMKCYIVGNKYYGLIVYTITQNDNNSEMEEFFNSFKIKDSSK